jgi:hypothetical protein
MMELESPGSKTGSIGAVTADLGSPCFFRSLLDVCFFAVILNEIVKQGKRAKHNQERKRKAVKRFSPKLFLPAIPYRCAKHDVRFPVR